MDLTHEIGVSLGLALVLGVDAQDLRIPAVRRQPDGLIEVRRSGSTRVDHVASPMFLGVREADPHTDCERPFMPRQP